MAITFVWAIPHTTDNMQINQGVITWPMTFCPVSVLSVEAGLFSANYNRALGRGISPSQVLNESTIIFGEGGRHGQTFMT